MLRWRRWLQPSLIDEGFYGEFLGGTAAEEDSVCWEA